VLQGLWGRQGQQVLLVRVSKGQMGSKGPQGQLDNQDLQDHLEPLGLWDNLDPLDKEE